MAHSEFFQLPSLRVHALVAGPKDGDTVLLLHGFPELAESWRDILDALGAQGFRAVAPDMRGYGETEHPETGYDLNSLSADVAALIEQLGGKVHLIGHDWGGAISYDVAAHYPERIRSLTVLNAPHPRVMVQRMWNPVQLFKSWYMIFFQLPFLPERMLSKNRGEAIAKLLAKEVKGMTEERLAPYRKAFSTPEQTRLPLAYYREAGRALLQGDSWKGHKNYPKIQAPFRLIWGTRDLALGRGLSENLDAYFEKPVEVKYLEGVGHFGHLEVPDQIAPLMLEHLRANA